MSEPSDAESVYTDPADRAPPMKKIRGNALASTGRAAFTYEVGRFCLLHSPINPEYHRMKMAAEIL